MKYLNLFAAIGGNTRYYNLIVMLIIQIVSMPIIIHFKWDMT